MPELSAWSRVESRGPNQRDWLRLVNPGEAAATVTIEGIDDQGDSPGEAVTFGLPPGSAYTLTSRQLEPGEGPSGALGDGTQPVRNDAEDAPPSRRPDMPRRRALA